MKIKTSFIKGMSFFKELEEKIIQKYSNLSIIFSYNVVLIFTAVVFINLIPILLNYPPYLSEYLKLIGAFPYLVQCIGILFFILLTGNLFLIKLLKGINKWEKYLYEDSLESQKNLKEIRKKCLNLPYLIYISLLFFMVIPVIVVLVILTAINKTTFYYIPKIAILIFSFISLTGIISLIFSKRIFTRILFRTYRNENLQGKRITLKTKIFIQVLPMIIMAILFTSLVGYSRLIDEKGQILYKLYKYKLEDKFRDISKVENINQIRDLLNEVSIENGRGCKFIVTPEKKVITSDGSNLSKLFSIAINNLSSKLQGRLYSEDGEIQGVMLNVKGTNGDWIVGIKYEVASFESVLFFLFGFITLLALNIFVLYYFSKSLSDDISLVANSLTEIAEGADVNLDQKIPVTSNDEIGDLVIAFNKIQEREKQHIKSIEEKQNLLLEKERLASLGQLIGGIAHNLRTPIMSLSGSIEALKDLSKEYDESIEDPSVTKEDHHEIAREIANWLETMQPYCSYMSDLISAVREQAVQLNASMYKSFTLEELVKRIEMLMNYELKKCNCTFNMELEADLNTEIPGELNNLVQIFNNLIVNAIQSYDAKGGSIDFKITKGDKRLDFAVRDYGKGIPKEIQSRLFKEMVTTKGKYGTGLGLYLSNVNIKGRFAGDIRFESEEGKGTTFYISIPYKKHELPEVT